MDIGAWLGGLGLGQYEAAFREHHIEVDVLPELTDQHLGELGIALGHRLRILRAVRELTGDVPQTVEPTLQEAPERRHLTIMFCDLVGSTALTARLDPEDMADLIRVFQSAVATAVARFDGHIAKWMGDAALVYFGYPRAYEDGAGRAARAGLALIDAVALLRQEREVSLEVRIGVSSGLVVVGELTGEGEAWLRGLVGDTPNLAMRLQDRADPGALVVSDSTRRLLGKAFAMRALGPQTIKGFEAEIEAWQILYERADVSRFEASHSGALTPFIGREHEITLLAERWRQCTAGDGQVVLVPGEAGIGKSRLIAMLRERIGTERHIVLRYQCSPHHINDAFYPVMGQIWHVAGLTSGEPPATRLEKLEKMVRSTGLACDEIVPYLAALFGLPTAPRYPVLDLPPSELMERTIAVLLAMVAGLAKAAPILMIVEDAHWIDPTSRDQVGRIVEMIQQLPVLLVITYRPEFSAPWADQSHAAVLSLSRFTRPQAVAMVEGVTAGRRLPSEVLEQIVAKTDGVPLFMEELTKSVLESGLLREQGDAYVLASVLTPLAIPSTLHDSLTARLDRLSPIKEIAQIGAAIGREFSHALLEAVAPSKGAALDEALRQLIDAELIHSRGAGATASYVFKHALVQDAAYGSLLRSRRQRIHADIAQVLQQHATEEEYPPATIAHHYTEAGLAEPAAQSWLAAAEQALSQSAPVEAERHASTGLSLILRIAPGPARDALELALLVARANALVPLKSISAPETFAALTAAKQLLDRGIGTDLQRVSVLYGLCSATTLTARLSQAFDLAHQIIAVAERQDDPTYRLIGHRQLGTIQFYTGNNREALTSLRKGDSYRDPAKQKALGYRFGWDQSLAVLSFEVLVRLSLGLLDSAAHVGAQVRRELEGRDHPTTVASATFCVTVWPAFVLRDINALERDGSELAAYCTEKKVEQIRLLAVLLSAYARAMRDPIESNIVSIRDALVALRKSGGNTGNSIILSNLAEAFLTAGDLDAADAALSDGFAFVDQSGETYFLADLHRLKGLLALRKPAPDRQQAADCFAAAIAVARSQDARLLELRAATDLARLWHEDGGHDPRALLLPILDTIEGGETARDVRDARALLSRFV